MRQNVFTRVQRLTADQRLGKGAGTQQSVRLIQRAVCSGGQNGAAVAEGSITLHGLPLKNQ